MLKLNLLVFEILKEDGLTAIHTMSQKQKYNQITVYFCMHIRIQYLFCNALKARVWNKSIFYVLWLRI